MLALPRAKPCDLASGAVEVRPHGPTGHTARVGPNLSSSHVLPGDLPLSQFLPNLHEIEIGSS
jgi:hypothetical protein